jgi:hypothetical protein
MSSHIEVEETLPRIKVRIGVNVDVDDLISMFDDARVALELVDEAALELAANLEALISTWKAKDANSEPSVAAVAEPASPAPSSSSASTATFKINPGEEDGGLAGVAAPRPDSPPSAPTLLADVRIERARRLHPSSTPPSVVALPPEPRRVIPMPVLPALSAQPRRHVDHDAIRALAAESI